MAGECPARLGKSCRRAEKLHRKSLMGMKTGDQSDGRQGGEVWMRARSGGLEGRRARTVSSVLVGMGMALVVVKI